MLEEEYQLRRRLPRNLRTPPAPERPFEYAIRPADRTDLPDVREIYNHYVVNTAITFDEESTSLTQWREKFDHLQLLGLPFIVAESSGGQILGYALVSPWRTKRAYRFTVENSIYLGAASTGKGLGPVLLAELIGRSETAGLKEMIAVITDKGAEASLKMHRNFGFREIGRMGHVGYKFDRWLGTVLLQKSLARKPSA